MGLLDGAGVSWYYESPPADLREEALEVLGEILRMANRGRRAIRLMPVCRPFQPVAITHFHAVPELFLPCIGTGALVYEDGRHALSPGELTVVPRGVAHDEIADPGPYRNLVFAFGGGTRVHYHLGISGWGPSNSKVRTSATHHDPRSSRVVGYLNEAAAASVTSGEKAPLVSGLLLAGIALLRQIIDEASPSQDLDPLVERARHFVTTHLTHQDLGVGWIADRVRCNADHLSHRFRQVTGETLLSLITERRMEVATLLLRQSSEGVAQVARSCGYRDPAYFSRVFRKRFGQSPREWRKAQALSA